MPNCASERRVCPVSTALHEVFRQEVSFGSAGRWPGNSVARHAVGTGRVGVPVPDTEAGWPPAGRRPTPQDDRGVHRDRRRLTATDTQAPTPAPGPATCTGRWWAGPWAAGCRGVTGRSAGQPVGGGGAFGPGGLADYQPRPGRTHTSGTGVATSPDRGCGEEHRPEGPAVARWPVDPGRSPSATTPPHLGPQWGSDVTRRPGPGHR